MTIKQVISDYRELVGDKQFYQELVAWPFIFVGLAITVTGFAIIF